MDVNTFDFDYSEQKEFWFLLASDLHIGDRLFDIDRFKQDFDEAVRLNARIYINGDVMRLITTRDLRRYTKAEDKPGKQIIDDNIQEAFEILRPYANHIDLIGVGNHETAIIKHSGTDPIQWLIYLLNSERDVNKYGLIRHAGYSGFIKQVFRYGSHRSTRTYIIWYNHGTGSGGEVTGGMISLNRRKVYIDANLIWLAHIHNYQFDGSADIISLNKSDKIVIKKRRGIVTGCYLKEFDQTDSNTGYRYNFGEQQLRRIQSAGGVFIKHDFHNKQLKTQFIFS